MENIILIRQCTCGRVLGFKDNQGEVPPPKHWGKIKKILILIHFVPKKLVFQIIKKFFGHNMDITHSACDDCAVKQLAKELNMSEEEAKKLFSS